MRYWKDMNDKYGFCDGDLEPPNARECREVYVRALNAVAEHEGSKVRAIAQNRYAMHNCCLILTVPLAYFNTLTEDQVMAREKLAIPDNVPTDPGVRGDVIGAAEDDVWVEVVQDCARLGLDDYVVCQVRIDDEFERAIDKLKRGQPIWEKKEAPGHS